MIDYDVENWFKARFICESDENFPKDALHMSAKNETAVKGNKAVLNNCKYPLILIQADQN